MHETSISLVVSQIGVDDFVLQDVVYHIHVAVLSCDVETRIPGAAVPEGFDYVVEGGGVGVG